MEHSRPHRTFPSPSQKAVPRFVGLMPAVVTKHYLLKNELSDDGGLKDRILQPTIIGFRSADRALHQSCKKIVFYGLCSNVQELKHVMKHGVEHSKPETEKLASDLAALTGETKTEAVTKA
jgi:hypothetical protein